MKLKINPEYEKLLPPISPIEYEALKTSIKLDGLFYPITINERGVILDGHHRYKACLELELEPKYEIKHFENELYEKRFVLESNLLRRQVTTFMRYELSKPLLEIERELAKERMLFGKKYPTLMLEEGEAVEKVSKQIGMSPALYYQAIYVDENIPEKEFEKVRSGEKTISFFYRKIKRDEQIAQLKEQIKTLPVIEGIFDVIVVDPPWPMEGKYNPYSFRGVPPYPTMNIDEIKEIQLPYSNDCVLWLWTINKFIHDAFHVLEVWGFEPKTVLTWVKHKFGLGVWLRGQTEHCIMAIKGKPLIELTNQTTALFGEAREHSRKPESFYELVDSMCYGRKLDYFGREEREGWIGYGTIR